LRTFTCFTFDRESSVPATSFILAADEARARALARRELLQEPRSYAVEMRERGKVVWKETIQDADPGMA
jgi:hypothetical protein